VVRPTDRVECNLVILEKTGLSCSPGVSFASH
jgi:hypothetical protein